MITLNVEGYCANCPYFEPELEVHEDCDDVVNTYIYCVDAKKCEKIRKYLKTRGVAIMNGRVCKDCVDRVLGCHARCEKYIKECEDRRVEKARIQLDSEWSKYAYDRHDEIEKVTRRKW